VFSFPSSKPFLIVLNPPNPLVFHNACSAAKPENSAKIEPFKKLKFGNLLVFDTYANARHWFLSKRYTSQNQSDSEAVMTK